MISLGWTIKLVSMSSHIYMENDWPNKIIACQINYWSLNIFMRKVRCWKTSDAFEDSTKIRGLDKMTHGFWTFEMHFSTNLQWKREKEKGK